jgi:hypothetical protein
MIPPCRRRALQLYQRQRTLTSFHNAPPLQPLQPL